MNAFILATLSAIIAASNVAAWWLVLGAVADHAEGYAPLVQAAP